MHINSITPLLKTPDYFCRMKILDRKIILASKSPRRSQLLVQAGFNFEIKTKEVEEDFPADMPVDEVAPFLAEKKATACSEFLSSDSDLLLSADSVVILDDKIYGKPVDYEDAVQILTALSGRIHRVITGVCLLSKSKKRVFAEVAHVHFQPLTDDEIRYYIDLALMPSRNGLASAKSRKLRARIPTSWGCRWKRFLGKLKSFNQ
jgi:septum formation protein